MVFERESGTVTHTIFKELFSFLPKDTAILLNDTRVVKARIFGKKQSGGEVELLLNSPLQDNHFSVYIKGRVKVGMKLFFDEALHIEVLELKDDGTRVVAFFQNDTPLNTNALFDVLEKIGHIPLPPYIKREDTQEDSEDYQTLFAKEKGAVAAPTASLHFTTEMFEKMKKEFETHFLTLHVGAGTFKPVEAEHILDHTMHQEFYSIPSSTCNTIKSDKNILAVGTTVTRTVEYFARTNKECGKCDLFLHPNNKPIRVNHLLTNFHLPKSTLIMLVASFIGVEKTLKLYEEAVKEKYRFFSYGDVMLIL